MDKAGSLLCATYTILLILLLSHQTCSTMETINHHCATSCGIIHNISFPFRLKGDPPNCGHSNYTLFCESNIAVLYLYSGKYYVQAINYNNYTIRLVDAALQKNNCSFIPRYTLTHRNFSGYSDPYTLYSYRQAGRHFSQISNSSAAFINCENPVNSPHYVDTAPCINGTIYSSNTSLTHLKRYSYVMVGDTRISELENLCRVELVVMMMWSQGKEKKNTSYIDIHNDLSYGFELSWFPVYCDNCSKWDGYGYCYLDDTDHLQCVASYSYNWYMFLKNAVEVFAYAMRQFPVFRLIVFFIIFGLPLVKLVFGGPFVFAFLIHKWQRRHISMHDNVEEFLQSHNNLMPIRYSYANIKKMTSGFKDKLGEGGYGSVYKGKLRSELLVAIKLLSKSKANGQDFINEVSSIGRIHHTNVVQLVGFCAEGSKRALVYDFMPNGSLDKYIFHKEGSNGIPISWNKMHEISLGVARGIEYLHRGCDMKILHFDIKPHNILLDENFTAKVSDFGLAKLYPVDDSIVSLTMARGTIGYIAPELFYKNIGGISYKADVYSYGMLLMEIIGRRKNLNAFAEHTSQIYFPSWVYDQIIDGKDMEIGDDATEEEKRIVEKLIIVALWCIQMQPSDRPAMNKVIEMLEGDVGCLQIPPKPFVNPQQIPAKEDGTNTNSLDSSTLGDCTMVDMPVADAGMNLSSVSAESLSFNITAN